MQGATYPTDQLEKGPAVSQNGRSPELSSLHLLSSQALDQHPLSPGQSSQPSPSCASVHQLQSMVMALEAVEEATAEASQPEPAQQQPSVHPPAEQGPGPLPEPEASGRVYASDLSSPAIPPPAASPAREPVAQPPTTVDQQGSSPTSARPTSARPTSARPTSGAQRSPTPPLAALKPVPEAAPLQQQQQQQQFDENDPLQVYGV